MYVDVVINPSAFRRKAYCHLRLPLRISVLTFYTRTPTERKIYEIGMMCLLNLCCCFQTFIRFCLGQTIHRHAYQQKKPLAILRTPLLHFYQQYLEFDRSPHREVWLVEGPVYTHGSLNGGMDRGNNRQTKTLFVESFVYTQKTVLDGTGQRNWSTDKYSCGEATASYVSFILPVFI